LKISASLPERAGARLRINESSRAPYVFAPLEVLAAFLQE
jgi:hypothetical protein